MEFSTEVVEKMAEIMVEEMMGVMPEPHDMRELETGMREFLRQVGAEGLKRYWERADQAEVDEKEKACKWEGRRRYLFRRRGMILSVFGRIYYRRRYYTCPECGSGLYPLDNRMHLAAGEVTAGLAELLALAGVEAAFAESSRYIERFLLFGVSDNTLRKETERFGELQKAREAEWKRQSQDESWLQGRLQQNGKQPGRLYGSIDGVMAPCRGEWRELKNIAWYQVAKVRSYEHHRYHASTVGEQNDLQAQNITYHCDIQPSEQFGDLFWATACQRNADL